MFSDFKFTGELVVPDLIKGQPKKVGGLISTGSMDEGGEQLLQDGMDFSYFLKRGVIKDEHIKSTSATIGYPDSDSLKYGEYRKRNGDITKGWFMTATLLDTKEANKIYDIAKELEKAGRPLGWSVEGSYGERDPFKPNVVKKAFVRNVVVTTNPVNTDTELVTLAKSISGEISVNVDDDFVKLLGQVRDLLVKALTVDAAPVLGKESLDDKLKIETYGDAEVKCENCGQEKKMCKCGANEMEKECPKPLKMNKSEALEYITKKGLTAEAAARILTKIDEERI